MLRSICLQILVLIGMTPFQLAILAQDKVDAELEAMKAALKAKGA